MRPNARSEDAFPLIEGVVDKYRLKAKTIDTTDRRLLPKSTGGGRYITRRSTMNNIKRGEIYYADFPFTIGSEQRGRRPVLILQNNLNNRFSPTTIVAAITSQDKNPLPTHVPIPVGCLKRDSTVLLEQLRTIDKARLRNYIGKLDKETMGKVDYAIISSLGIKTMEELLK